MADFIRFLPFSNSPPVDEAGVSSDRHALLADVVDAAAALIAARAGTAEPAGEDAARTFVEMAHLERDAAQLEPDGAATLREVAVNVRGGKRRSIRALAHGVRALLVLSERMGGTVTLAPVTSGAVALYAVTAAPFERRAVVSGHALRATDAGWEFGRGPVLEGTAQQIVAFLLGVSDVPPARATDERASGGVSSPE